jgi:hypothetical protein
LSSIKSTKQIEEAFEQINKGSCISNLEEISNIFIKSEGQDFLLYSEKIKDKRNQLIA